MLPGVPVMGQENLCIGVFYFDKPEYYQNKKQNNHIGINGIHNNTCDKQRRRHKHHLSCHNLYGKRNTHIRHMPEQLHIRCWQQHIDNIMLSAGGNQVFRHQRQWRAHRKPLLQKLKTPHSGRLFIS